MNTQRQPWGLIGSAVLGALVLGLALMSVFHVRSQPVFGQAPGPLEASAQTGISAAIYREMLDEAFYLNDTGILPRPMDVVKSYAPDKPSASDTLTFTIAVRNPNTFTFGITVTDQLQPQFTMLCESVRVVPEEPSPVCDEQQNALTYIAPLTAHTGMTLTFQARIADTLRLGDYVTNTVWVDNGERIISRTVTVKIAGPAYIYLPLIARRWPPIPYPPTDVNATPPNIQGNYTITWAYVSLSPDVPEPTHYELQEASDASFSAPQVYVTPLKSYSFTDKPSGFYYYRVRAVNSYGPGSWTAMPVVNVVRMFVDGFSNPASGWRTGNALRYNFWDENHIGWEVVANLNYTDGHYQIYVPLHRGTPPWGDVDTFWVWPAVEAPLPASAYPLPDRYCIEARGKFDQPAWVARWGIVFGANADFDQLYAFNINDNGNRALIHYQNYLFPGNNSFRHCVYQGDCERNKKNFLVGWYGGGTSHPYIYPAPAYNTLKVVVRGRQVDMYSNGVFIDSFIFSRDFPRERIGLMGGNWEVTPVDLRVDYFRYNPGCAEAHQ